jgi:hypothetical protein
LSDIPNDLFTVEKGKARKKVFFEVVMKVSIELVGSLDPSSQSWIVNELRLCYEIFLVGLIGADLHAVRQAFVELSISTSTIT